jgi:hypothetical protein
MDKVKIGKYEYTEEELEKNFIEATRRGEEELARAPKAVSAKFDRKTKRLVVELKNGVVFMIPTDLIQGLRGASAVDISAVELWMEGMYLHWEKLDVDFRVSSLMNGVFGTPKWMAELKESSKQTIRKPQRKVA